MIINQVIEELCDLNLITTIPFVVTDELRAQYVKQYCKLTGGNSKSLPSNNRKYALKLAGLNLLKFGGNTESGFVYCISNPSFPNHIKVGMTKDITKRLASYQTYDPFRAFKIETYRFVENKRNTEKLLLNKYKIDTDKGEWLSDLSVIKYVKTLS